MTKFVNALIIQIKSEKIELINFLFQRRVFDVKTKICECDFFKQTIKHVLLFCLLHSNRSNLRAAESLNFQFLTDDFKNIKAATL